MKPMSAKTEWLTEKKPQALLHAFLMGQIRKQLFGGFLEPKEKQYFA